MGFEYYATIDEFADNGSYNYNDTYVYEDNYTYQDSYEAYLDFVNTSAVTNLGWSISNNTYYLDPDSGNWTADWTMSDWGFGLNQSSPSIPVPFGNSNYLSNLTERLSELTALNGTNNATVFIDFVSNSPDTSYLDYNWSYISYGYLVPYDFVNVTIFYQDATYNYFNWTSYQYETIITNLTVVEEWNLYGAFIPQGNYWQNVHVNVTYTNTGYYKANGTYQSTGSYASNFTSFYVSIYNIGSNFGINYYAPIYWSYSWNETVYSEEYYENNYTDSYVVTALDPIPGLSGSTIPSDWLPGWMQQNVYYTKGYTKQNYTSAGTSDAVTAMQYFDVSMWSYTGNSNGTSFSYQSTYWANFIPGALQIFDDRNGNGILDLIANQSSPYYLAPSDDSLEYIAYLEAYSYSYYYNGSYYDDSYTYSNYGGYVYEYNTTIDEPSVFYNDTYTFGPPIPSTFDYSPYFNLPNFDNSTNTIKFSWGIDFTDFPVWFLNWTDFTENTSYMDLSYRYDLNIVLSSNNPLSITQNSQNLTTATIALDTSYYFGEVKDSALRQEFSGLSLANTIDSWFYTDSYVEEVSSSAATTVATNSLQFSSGNTTLASVDLSGQKANYTLMTPSGNQTYQAKASKITLFSVAGSVSGNSTALYEDHSSNQVNTVVVNTSYSYTYQYIEALLITSYGTWDGYGIVHDPTFSSVSVINAPSGGDSSGGGDDTSGQQPSEGNKTSDTDTSPEATGPEGGDTDQGSGVVTPGFEILATVIPITLGGIISLYVRTLRKKQRHP